MNKAKLARMIAVVTILCLLLPAVYGQAGKTTKKEFAFRGKVEKVDANAKILSVNGESVPGWMAAMTMNYAVDNEAVLKTVKVGDQITAKVYEGDFKVLHEVQVVQAK